MTSLKPLQKIQHVVVILIFLTGCGNPAPIVGRTRDEAEKRFIEIVEEKYQYPMVVRQVENTLWIYLPIKEPLIHIKASKEGPNKVNQASEKLSLKFIDTKYDGKKFLIEYDIGTSENYPQSFGYTSVYGEGFQKIQSNIFGALQRAYFDVGLVPGDVKYFDPKKDKTHTDFVNAHVNTDKPPEFIVLVITDIVNGIEIINTFSFEDFKRIRSHTPTLSQSEYVNRNLSRVEGNQAAVDDLIGRHVPFTPVALGDFIAQQITHRVNFKYNSSSFPPSEDALAEIKSSAAQAIGAYKFSQFESVGITHLKEQTTATFTKDQILSLPKANEKPEGKIHIINFSSPEEKGI